MATLSNVRGLRFVIANFNRAQERDGRTLNRVLKKAGLIVQRLSQLQVPVDEGILKNTAFTRARGRGFKTAVNVGYTAAYAIFVHEDLEALHGEAYNREYADKIAAGVKGFNNKGLDQKAKFLSDPMQGLPRNPSYKTMVKLEALRGAKL